MTEKVIDQKKKKKKWVRIFKWSGLAVLVILVSVGAWVAYSASNALGQISENGFSFKELFSESVLKSDDGRTNILLLGNGGSNHPGGQLTDTNILLSYNHDTEEAALISFPRDLYVDIADGGGTARLNEAYAYGESNSESTGGGGVVAKDTISEIAGVPIHYYIEADFVGLKELVDSLDGVTVNVETAISDPYYPKDYFDEDGNYYKTTDYNPFYLSAGIQELDGITALKYARSRETTSDFDRAARQQNLIMSIRDKALSLGILANPANVVEVIDVLGQHIKTDMSVGEIKELASLSKSLDLSSVKREVVDNSSTGLLVSTTTNAGAYILLPKTGDYDAIHELVQNIFTDEEASNEGEVAGASTSAYGEGSIEIYNGTGVPGEARKLAPLLRDKGLDVTALKTSPSISSETILYDYTSGYDTASLGIVKKLVPNVKVISRSDSSGDLDFKLILGEDYTGE